MYDLDLITILEDTLALVEVCSSDTNEVEIDIKAAIVRERIKLMAISTRGLDSNEKRAEDLKQEEIEMYSYWNHRDDRS